MNKQRRKQIDQQIAMIEEKKSLVEAAIESQTKLDEDFSVDKSEIENIKDEEDEAYNNLPESLQNGEKGEAMQEAINCMDNAISEIDEFENVFDQSKTEKDDVVFHLYQSGIEHLESAIENLSEATQQ